MINKDKKPKCTIYINLNSDSNKFWYQIPGQFLSMCPFCRYGFYWWMLDERLIPGVSRWNIKHGENKTLAPFLFSLSNILTQNKKYQNFKRLALTSMVVCFICIQTISKRKLNQSLYIWVYLCFPLCATPWLGPLQTTSLSVCWAGPPLQLYNWQ